LKILILNTDYPSFVNQLYAENNGLAYQNYDTQWNARVSSLFGVADYYSKAFKLAGHDAEEVFANTRPLFNAWCKLHGRRQSPFQLLRDRYETLRGRYTLGHEPGLRAVEERIIGKSFAAYSQHIAEYPEKAFSVVVVDGRARPSCLAKAIPYIESGGLLVLDNSDREYYLEKTLPLLRAYPVTSSCRKSIFELGLAA
jgi:hypothetical protein